MADTRKVVFVVAGSVAATGTILALVFSLAGWAYRHRDASLHDGRLKRVVEKHPTMAQVSEAILAEPGNRALPTPAPRTSCAGFSPAIRGASRSRSSPSATVGATSASSRRGTWSTSSTSTTGARSRTTSWPSR